MKGLKTVEMKFMRRTAEYSLLDHRRNEDILKLKECQISHGLKQS